MTERLEELYEKKIKSELAAQMKVNLMAVPKVEKVIVSAGIGRFKDDPKLIESATADLRVITGQSPKLTRSKKAISSFKLKANEPIGLIVTLRGERMWSFLDKLISVVLPRLRDFRGVSRNSFDRHGNLSLGFAEHTLFPEIDTNKAEKAKSLGVTIATSAHSDEAAFLLLSKLGFPFKRG